MSFNNLQKLNSRLDTCIELIVLQFFAKILKKVLSFFSNLPFLPALSNTLSDTFRNFGGFSVIKISAGKIRGISQSGSLDISEFWIRIRIILCKPHFHQSALKDPEFQFPQNICLYRYWTLSHYLATKIFSWQCKQIWVKPVNLFNPKSKKKTVVNSGNSWQPNTRRRERKYKSSLTTKTTIQLA